MKLIFGIRTTGTVSLSVTAQGQLPDQPPSLMIKSEARETPETPVSCSNNTWTTTLAAGDYVVYIPASGDSWFKNSLSFALSAPVTIVSLSSSQSPQAWTATMGTIGASPFDAKNPLPPPDDASVPPPDATWLTSTLGQMTSAPNRTAPDHLFARSSEPAGSQ
jgi:hypothetical protein